MPRMNYFWILYYIQNISRIFNKFRIFAFRIFRIFRIFWREKFRIPHFTFYFFKKSFAFRILLFIF